MSKQVKYIDLVFENCEWVRFTEGVGHFHLGKFETSVDRVAMNSIRKHTLVKEVAMQISKDAKYERDKNFSDDTPIFERIIKWNDITHIDIGYVDGSEESYYVDYEEPEGEEDMLGAPNINQKSVISDGGNLYIVIHKEKDIKDCFNNLDECDHAIDIFTMN